MIKEQLPVAGQRKLMHPEVREMKKVHDDRSQEVFTTINYSSCRSDK